MKKILLRQPVTIVANGNFPTHQNAINILKESNCIIACDGAANKLIENNYHIDYIIGDLDSISRESIKLNKNKVILIKDQSENDLRKAIKFLIHNNIKKFNILGATGKREDHTLGNIFSIYDYKTNYNAIIYTNYGLFKCLKDKSKIISHIGQQVSLFTPDNTIKISSKGLKYNFKSESLNSLFIGTLNESTSDIIEINLSHGKVLVFQEYKSK